MPNINRIRECFLSDLSSRSPETRRTRLFWVNKWLSFMGNRPLSDWNKVSVQEFQKRIQKDGYAESSVSLAIGIVKRAFDAAAKAHEQERLRVNSEIRERRKSIDPNAPNAAAMLLSLQGEADDINSLPGPDWDLGKRYAPEVQRESMKHPAISMDDLKKQIDAAKSGKLESVETAFLALASVYGMRKCELIAVEPQHLDYRAGFIWIDTHKHGEKRNQLLVPEIIPYLQQYDFKLQYNDGQLWKMFKSICRKSGVEILSGQHESWHAYRRRVHTEIMNTLSADHDLKAPAEYLAHLWERWKISSISERYYTNDEADKIVAAHNPIINLWR
jgi:integrase